MKRCVTIVALFLLASAAVGEDPLTIPNTFSPGASISSSQMNDNFTVLVNAINTLQTKVNAQAETIASQANLISGLESLNSSSRACGFVNSGEWLTLDTLKASVTTTAPWHLQLETKSGTLLLCGTSRFTTSASVSGDTIPESSPVSVSTTATSIKTNYTFAAGQSEEWTLRTTNNSAVWRIYALFGADFSKNFIMIEKLK